MLCAWQHCRDEETNCTSTKCPVVSFTLLLVDIIKWSGRILDSLFPSKVHFKKLLKLTFFKSSNCPYRTTKHTRTEWKIATASSLPNQAQAPCGCYMILKGGCTPCPRILDQPLHVHIICTINSPHHLKCLLIYF